MASRELADQKAGYQGFRNVSGASLVSMNCLLTTFTKNLSPLVYSIFPLIHVSGHRFMYFLRISLRKLSYLQIRLSLKSGAYLGSIHQNEKLKKLYVRPLKSLQIKINNLPCPCHPFKRWGAYSSYSFVVATIVST